LAIALPAAERVGWECQEEGIGANVAALEEATEAKEAVAEPAGPGRALGVLL